MAHSDEEAPLVLQTDASQVGLGAVLVLVKLEQMQAVDPLKKPFPTCVFDHLGPFPLSRVFTIEWKPASDGCFRLLRENNGASCCSGHWARKFEAIHNPTADHELLGAAHAGFLNQAPFLFRSASGNERTSDANMNRIITDHLAAYINTVDRCSPKN
ncbi:hypothetical protein T10_1629 [Trichinella papuae]|uniref:Uncharacterized protein n=1 Tax=Trichinella papuae TaxID=268474 RepID=A0A0V1MX44_9BILA|nr:hypothetical protein T10_1629 [Trichinella papuae]